MTMDGMKSAPETPTLDMVLAGSAAFDVIAHRIADEIKNAADDKGKISADKAKQIIRAYWTTEESRAVYAAMIGGVL